jgi:predicted nucleic acid-binding protein
MITQYLEAQNAAVISTQVMLEYYAATTRPKRGNPPIFTRAEAQASIAGLVDSCVCIDTTSTMARASIAAATRYQMNVYDAAIWSAANAWRIPFVLTGDWQSRPWIDGVRFVNPYDPSFQLAHIGL